MVAHGEMLQCIARLTPLAEALLVIQAWAKPVAPQQMPLSSAFGRILAEDAVGSAACPANAVALRDGWAVHSNDLADASAYAPIPLLQSPAWLETGDPVPPGADAVAPLDAVVWRNDSAEVVAPVAPGEGVLSAAVDVQAGVALRPRGTRLRRIDVAALAAAGIERVTVRTPRIALVRAGPGNAVLNACVDLIAGAIAGDGANAVQQTDVTPDHLDRAFRDTSVDAIVVIGGTGSGRRDASVRALARSGKVAMHGIAVSPGDTAAFGVVDNRPALLVPGRLDAALAIWLLIGRPMLGALCGRVEGDPVSDATLSRKVASSLGLTEVVLVKRIGATCEPIASSYLSLSALAQADGWIVVPPESEGHPAGTRVIIGPLP